MSTAGKPTDWSTFTLHQIWAMLRDERDDAAYDQIRVWFQIEYICRHHADQLTAALASLASAWPPAKGNAAEHFQEYVKSLIANLTRTSDAANANGRALTNYHGDLMATRRKVAELIDKYPEKATGLAASGIVARRDQLAAEAHTVMTAADKSAHLFAQLMDPPPAYLASGGVKGRTEPPDGKKAGGVESAGFGGQPFNASGVTTAPRSSSGFGSGADSGAPILAGGIDPITVSTPGTPGSGTPGTSGSGTPMTGGGAPVGRVIGGSPDAIRSGGAGGGSSAAPLRPGTAGSGVASGSTGHAGAAGGMLGAPMMMGGASTTRDGTRVGRPGGVIGGQRGKRRRPPDPADPWAIDPDMVDPVIRPRSATSSSDPDDDFPPGVVSIEGWPR